MPIFDHRCLSCSHIFEAYVPVYTTNAPCPACQGETEHIFQGGRVVTISDSVPGGFFVENISKDGMWFSSKSDYHRELKRRNMQNMVRHQGSPGSDKSSITTRWV